MALAGNNPRERKLLKWIAAGGVLLITVGLCLLNTTGAYQASGGNWYYTITMGGAEILLVPIFGLIVLAQSWARRLVGGLIFVGLVWTCVENGKFAVKHSFDGIFVDTPDSLRQKARVITDRIPDLREQEAATAINNQNELIRLREDIAKLEAEQELMASATRIEEAQTRLKALGKYTGRIDGLREELTETAMLQRGEVITREMDLLRRQASALSIATGTVQSATNLDDIGEGAIVLTPAQEAEATAIKLNKQADEIEYRTVWMHVILWALEGARSFGVWAFLMTSTAAGTAAAFAMPATAKPEDEDEPVADLAPDDEGAEDGDGQTGNDQEGAEDATTQEDEIDEGVNTSPPMTRAEVWVDKSVQAKRFYARLRAIKVPVPASSVVDAQEVAAE